MKLLREVHPAFNLGIVIDPRRPVRNLTRWLAVAAFAFRLVALFPVLFAAEPAFEANGITICRAGGGQTLPVSESQQIGLLCPACANAADQGLLLPTPQSLPLPRVGFLHRVAAKADPAPLAAIPYAFRARAPPEA